MQFFNDYFLILDGLALLALVGFAVVVAIQNKGFALLLGVTAVSVWAVVRFFELI